MSLIIQSIENLEVKRIGSGPIYSGKYLNRCGHEVTTVVNTQWLIQDFPEQVHQPQSFGVQQPIILQKKAA